MRCLTTRIGSGAAVLFSLYPRLDDELCRAPIADGALQLNHAHW
jgi:hypothetical protein